ncbi:hypothetical protein BU16DRAFT_32182 [Lophium mytilinum]|uniref:DUF676 domain-containing protein n=1 Tax=Lophium mytilinum TaxID=390894 RepID=A0A6A6RFQ2_9PEZI|nr:hypothetical protein BU16DRAFT_32182 [Lophium mytilinum]
MISMADNTSARRRTPPPLPPRGQSNAALLTASSEPPPAYSPYSPSMASNDPRTSSTQSLVPVPESEHAGRRTLLLVYVHGFMGNETSFQSFPAHVHNLVTVTLADTHVVHTKIYPKYKSRRAIEFARDDFSTWLDPHESPTTDVILLGHSMGGLLCSEVALVPPYSPSTDRALRHRLIGTINFDVPFLGMHPGVVVSGLGSIFRPADSPAPPTSNESSSGSTSNVNRVNTFFSPKPSDPNYNPVFPNDVNLPERSGWGNALHFISKHSDGLMNATKTYVTSHLEFGGTMADYGALKKRYARIRALEEEDEAVRRTATSGPSPPPRVRFINYYTASTGRPKKPKSPSSSRKSSQSSSRKDEEGGGRLVEAEMEDMQLTSPTTRNTEQSRSPSVTSWKSAEEHRNNEAVAKEFEEPLSANSEHDEGMDMRHIDSMPIDDEVEHNIAESTTNLSLVTTQQTTDSSVNPLTLENTAITSPTSTLSLSSSITLPPIPPVPDEPPSVDFSQYTDKDTRKLAEKEYARVMKNYKQTVKDRNSAIKDRAKLEEKIEKSRRKEAEKAKKSAEKEAEKAKKLAEKEAADRQNEPQEPEKEMQEPEKEKEEEFSWEKVWAADRARETRQRDYERLTREGKTEEAEALLNDGKKPPQEDPVPKTLTRQSTHEPLTQQSTQEPLTQQSTLEPTSSATSGTYHHSTTNILNSDTPSARTEAAAAKAESKKKENPKAAKPKRDKKFCMLPPTDAHGRLDPTWFRVYMEGVDEVGAHCGLFFVSETYERLVGDVGARIEEWVREDMTERLVRELGGDGL